jgi:hypothetical protein
MPFVYKRKTAVQLRTNYNDRRKRGLNGFISFDDFQSWYSDQDLSCHFCGLSELEMQEITMAGILTSKRFPQNGVIGQGTSRAVWLEVDRIDPNGLYSRDNCVLCCYYCNNDKSDVFSGNSYSNFYQNRVTFLRQLLHNSRENRQ